MPTRRFELNRDGSRIIAVSQAGARTPMTVSLNDRILGTLPPPEKLHAGRAFKLDDGSTLTVRVMGRLVQVRHDGLPLWEVSPKAMVSDKVIRRIMLPCASFALIMGLVSLCIFLNVASSVHPSGGTGNCFDWEHGPCGAPTSQGNGPTSQPPSPFNLPVAIFALGYGLFSLIAFLVGVSHAVANRAWGWVGFGFLSPPLLLIIPLVYLGTHLNIFDLGSTLLFLLTFVVGFFLLPAICLAYARSLEE